ncbi:MAG: radical SAM protein, partial [Desulfobulbales bacterium]|nr:radical SAM protein [Desulfobulbales bacterium]
MLTGIHFILTYTCNFECDHCFLHCSPRSQGTFTIGQVTEVLDEALKIGTVADVFFEGGEPFMYFPLLNESVRRACERGFAAGVVTNGYGATSEEDSELWLKPLVQSGLSCLHISNDPFHYGDKQHNPASVTAQVAKRLGIEAAVICIETPEIIKEPARDKGKGRPVIDGGVKFRGRAVEKLSQDLPLRPWQELCECPYEDLVSPSRVHVDSYGNVQICQGISMGNMWQTPLSELVGQYQPDLHPICGPLIKGGPAELARDLGVKPEQGYIDECHLCYSTRRAVVGKYPDCIAPEQVYGDAG